MGLREGTAGYQTNSAGVHTLVAEYEPQATSAHWVNRRLDHLAEYMTALHAQRQTTRGTIFRHKGSIIIFSYS